MDGTKCLNEDCPIKKNCYRWTAPRNEYWQSVTKFQYQEYEGKVMCDWFWDNKGYYREESD